MDATSESEPKHKFRAKQLDALLAEARKRLIDTGTRNRLIHTNRRAKKPGTLALLYADLDQLYSELVRTSQSLRFRSDPRLSERHEVETSKDGLEPLPAPAHGSILQTRIAEETLQRRLLKFFRDAKTLEEEQGINILYLALGFLRWFEDENSEVLREAPLILVPVSLVRDARRSTFELRVREDDIETNLPLAERLREFGISLPEIPDEDQLIPSDYFNAVDQAISGKPRWSVDKNGAELGLFSFAKLLMFRDLAGHAWPNQTILDHPLLHKMMLDGFEPEEPIYPDDTKIDEKFAPSDLVHVVDADGSQTLAIETVRSGRNLVIQGPPGTGKSQTIANIIASAARDGKTVLFVAEKMVALEVVQSRLHRAGLEAICLGLHSRATNKRLLAEELERTLATPAAEPNMEKEAIRLKEIRDQLNAIALTLHKPFLNSGKTPFQIIGDLVYARGRNLPPPSLEDSALASWDLAAYSHVERLATRLAKKINTTGQPGNHPWREVRNFELQPPEIERLKIRLTNALQKLGAYTKLCHDGATLLAWPSPETYKDAHNFANLLDEIATTPLEQAPIIRRLSSLSDEALSSAITIATIGLDARDATSTFESLFKPAALTVNINAVRSPLAQAQSWFARLGSSYRKASAELGTWIIGPLPKAASDRIALIDKLREIQTRRNALSDYETQGRTLFADSWKGLGSDFAGIIAAANWLSRAKECGLRSNIENALFLAERGQTASLLSHKLRVDARSLQSEIQAIFEYLAVETRAAFDGKTLDEVSFEGLAECISIWSRSVERYPEWAELLELDSELRQASATDIADRLADGRLSAANAVDELRHARAEVLWRQALDTQPTLRKLKSENRNELVAQFKKLDTERRRGAAALIRGQHAQNMPRGAFGEMAIIRGEIARKRGHMPIRKLMQRAGRTIQLIKPVFMMSPISVAQYLSPGAVSFDLIVIDEASQVRPEDALGVIARGSQVVIVGDRHQLPPTNFFSRLLDNEAIEDEVETNEPAALAGAARATELESILTLCEARGLPSKMLRWHYRSRHPSLIEVSNAEFYASNLFLPPAPVADRGFQGLIAQRINGAYDRGGKRTNAIEAQAIVDAIVKHANTSPEMTLGVVTFSTAQRDLVSDYLDERRRTNPILDGFLNKEGEEVFVKNLENVQGDERDVILVSVGYGPRQVGSRLESMSFGPVSTDGGERRLNVLFTRARHRCEVFVSFDSGDIDLERATGAGPRVFKRFLAYAESGVLDQPVCTGADYDSFFEEDVATITRSLGYHIDAQVGSAGFKIDLAARHPESPGKYILAIECDGATYHSALWARERDRLRQEVLESMGWRFHRIWSTDWFYRRDEEIKRLKIALEEARTHSEIRQPIQTDTVSEPIEKTEVFEKPILPVIELTPYKTADFKVALRNEPHEAPINAMADIVSRIVEIEGPVHADEVARRVATL